MASWPLHDPVLPCAGSDLRNRPADLHRDRLRHLQALPVTLTLAGIAGFILSIGMAVDANVLIFARIKEELHMGRALIPAVESGFEHAWPSIRDSNITTMITTLILYLFGTYTGTSIITGFALTLFIGVVISMFTAIIVTRTLLRVLVAMGPVDPRLVVWRDYGRTSGCGRCNPVAVL